MRTRKKRGISFGSITMLFLTIASLIGFGLLLPTWTGNQDIRLDAAELAVAIDESFSQLVPPVSSLPSGPKNTPLPPTLPQQSSATQQPTATVAATPPPKQSFSLCATGSIILNSEVRKALTIDDTYQFDILTDHLTGAMQADLSIATLENTIIDAEKPSNLNMPSQLLSALRSTGLTALSVAHKDALNAGLDGLISTKQAITSAGMLPFGIAASAQERQQGTMLTLGGVNVALLSYQESISSTGRKQTSEEERAFAHSPLEIDRIRSDIANAKSRGAQVVIVSLCWGKAGASSPTDEQRELAQMMADAGADIILGTQTGALQPVQVLTGNRGDGKYHPVLCAYSLGNLMTHDREKRANLASILLKADVVYDPVTDCVAFDNLTYTPTYAWRGKVNEKTLYRVLLNNGGPTPDFVAKDQQGVMERCYNLVTEIMADTAIPMQ